MGLQLMCMGVDTTPLSVKTYTGHQNTHHNIICSLIYYFHTQCSLQVPSTVGAGWYAVALQVEDFATTSSTTPMSSVPVQFLVNIFTSTVSCGSEPTFTGATPANGDTVAIVLGDTWQATLTAESFGTGVR